MLFMPLTIITDNSDTGSNKAYARPLGAFLAQRLEAYAFALYLYNNRLIRIIAE